MVILAFVGALRWEALGVCSKEWGPWLSGIFSFIQTQTSQLTKPKTQGMFEIHVHVYIRPCPLKSAGGAVSVRTPSTEPWRVGVS